MEKYLPIIYLKNKVYVANRRHENKLLEATPLLSLVSTLPIVSLYLLPLGKWGGQRRASD